MKKLLLLSSAIVAASPALAADLPMKAPVAAVPYTWSGCHIGANIGGVWDRTTYSDPGTLAPGFLGLAPPSIAQNFAPAGTAFSSNSKGGILGGVQGGCDYQFASHWVIGFGGDYAWTSLNHVANDPFFAGKNGGPPLLTSQTDQIATLTGRIGYAWNRVLFYGKGGAAYAHDNYIAQNFLGLNNNFCNNAAGQGCIAYGSTQRWGWTAGVGLEYAFYENWSAFVEYDHYGFANKTIQMNILNGVTVPANLTARHDIDTVKFGVNYRIWSPGPVVARY